MKPPFIERVIIKNYKSIAKCDVRLGPLQFLVGHNGAGKSNFLDALAFVSDALTENSFERTADARRGIEQVYRRNGKTSAEFGMRLEFKLDANTTGTFAFEMDAGGNKIRREQCYIKYNGSVAHYYQSDQDKVSQNTVNFMTSTPLKEGAVSPEERLSPPVSPGRFHLHNMAVYEVYRQIYRALKGIGIYNFNPREMAPMSPERNSPPVLEMHGANIANIFDRLNEGAKERIQEYLRVIVPVIREVKSIDISDGEFKRLLFILETGQLEFPLSLPATNMSDGTLRAVGILTALLQKRNNEDEGVIPTLVGIKEPETALHASVSGVLLSALQEASETHQVIVATHSADMLDNKEVLGGQILPVEIKQSETCISTLDPVSAEMIKNHLTTAGELLRQDKLKSKLFVGERNVRQHSLFERAHA